MCALWQVSHKRGMAGTKYYLAIFSTFLICFNFFHYIHLHIKPIIWQNDTSLSCCDKLRSIRKKNIPAIQKLLNGGDSYSRVSRKLFNRAIFFVLN